MADITLVYSVVPTVQRQSVQVTRIGEKPDLQLFPVAPPPPNWARANNADEQLLELLGLYALSSLVDPPGGSEPNYLRTIVLRSTATFDQNFSTPEAKKSATRALFSSQIAYHLPSRQVVSAEPVVA